MALFDHPFGRRVIAEPVVEQIVVKVEHESRHSAPHTVYEIFIIAALRPKQATGKRALKSGRGFRTRLVDNAPESLEARRRSLQRRSRRQRKQIVVCQSAAHKSGIRAVKAY